jgi:hypothetical protein
MISPAKIQKHMDVVSSKSEPLGMVDHVAGTDLKLARDVVGQHHFVPLTWIDYIDEKIHLKRPAKDVERLWAGESFE